MEVSGNIYIDRFQLVAFANHILSQIYSHCIQNCNFWYFMEIKETFVLWKEYFQSLLIFVFFYIPKPVISITQKWLVVENCNSSMNNIFNVLYIGTQYTLSFKWTNFGLKCTVTITSKGQSLKFKASVWNIPNSETGLNCNSLF